MLFFWRFRLPLFLSVLPEFEKGISAVNLKLNWLGLYVSDFKSSLRFYSDVLGISTRVVKSDFALFRTTGMTLELFGGGMPPNPDRFWGHGQAVRPGIQVDDLQGTTIELRYKGVHFTDGWEQVQSGNQIELLGPEQVRWTLGHVPENPFSAGLSKPYIGWVELKVLHLAEQCAFYSDILGHQPTDQEDGSILFWQAPGEPLLFLKPGGEQPPAVQVRQGELYLPPPHLLGFETSSIEKTSAWVKFRRIPVLIDVTRRDWGGLEMIIADADGNPIQVVEYVRR